VFIARPLRACFLRAARLGSFSMITKLVHASVDDSIC
jgi:hypothetical protein